MIRDRYFDWLYGLISTDEFSQKLSYHQLLETLYFIPFRYYLPMDDSRAKDGVALRYRFGKRMDIPEIVIKNELDTRQCSVLEMLVALCLRCEEHIMHDDAVGDRTGKWFWDILENMHLTDYDDANFDSTKVREIVETFLTRRFKPNGEGSIATLTDCKYDLREVEIWDQMMWWLDYVIEEEGVMS
jgi:hypothetical protein